MRVGVVMFPGSHCDRDCAHAITHALGAEALMLWHRDVPTLDGLDGVIVPGGFSYGDYLRAGAIAKLSPVMGEVARFAGRGGAVLGICNGFQLLTELGLLPGALRHNVGLRFVCAPAWLRVDSTRSYATRALASGQRLRLPIAHAQGCYVADDVTMRSLEDGEQIMLRYCGPGGQLEDAYNPNGSAAHIAGICNAAGNVMGMMPHPERACEALLGGVDGRALLASAFAGGGA